MMIMRELKEYGGPYDFHEAPKETKRHADTFLEGQGHLWPRNHLIPALINVFYLR